MLQKQRHEAFIEILAAEKNHNQRFRDMNVPSGTSRM
jgi:hypothetical protein